MRFQLPTLPDLRPEIGAAEGWLEHFLHPESARAAPAAPRPSVAAPAPAPAPIQPPAVVGGVQNPEAFFNKSRGVLWPHLTQPQVDGCKALLLAGAGRLPLAWMAYALATTYHETAYTMQPIRERGSGRDLNHNGEDDWFEQYDVGPKAVRLGDTPEMDGDGAKWKGRGDCMITGEDNYRRADKRLHELGLLQTTESLLETPDLALRQDVAAAVLITGMLEGWFTGKKLRDYLPAHPAPINYVNARRIINGVDRAQQIAKYAMQFESCLQAGNWL